MANQKISLVALAFGLLPCAAYADDAASTAVPGDIVVTARLEKTARDEQRIAPNIVDIQSAQAIAKYPDINAAEALSRVPGVALSIDTSEGRFVNIRGLDGNFNGSTFGGVVLLNTQPGGTYFNAAGRAVEFDTIPIGAIDRIVVTKTGLPDHDAEGIGGTVELTPRTAIGTTKPFAEVTLASGIQTFSGNPLFRDEVVLGVPLGKNQNGGALFSFVMTQYLNNDRRRFDDLEAAYVNDQAGGTPDKAFDALELRKYQYRRHRFGYSGEFDFNPSDTQRIYLRASLAGYNERVVGRNRLEIDGLGDPVTVDPVHPNGFIATDASTVKTLRDQQETHKNLVLQLGGEHHFGEAKFDWFAAYSRATYDKLYDYNSNFAGPSGLTIAYDNITKPDYPTYSVLSGASITDPANYTLYRIQNSTENDLDREYSYAANLALPLHLVDGDEIKVGAKLRYRRKRSNTFSGRYNLAGASLSTLSTGAAVTNFYKAGYNIGPDVNAPALASLFNASGTPLTGGLAFDDTEDVSAAYAQYHAEFGPLGVLAGLRFEHTKAIYTGIGDVLSAGVVSTGTVVTRHTYDNVFPTVQLKYQISPTFIARATYSTGIARPGFFQTQQSPSIDFANAVVTNGNPNLKPITANSFDLGLEYYLPDSGRVSIGLFDKELKNYIVSGVQRGSYPGFDATTVVTINSFLNVPKAHARGIEAAFNDHFTALPGLLGGLGIDANVTYVSSRVALRPGETVAMPGTFKWSGNLAVFYEHGPIKFRLSAQYESEVLFGVGSTRAKDYFQDKRTTLDANASYDIGQSVQVFVNAKNLTNAPLRFYENTANRPGQREFYDSTFEGGVKFKF